MDNQPDNSVPLSVAALLESLAARLDRLHDGINGLSLRAVPLKAPGAGKVKKVVPHADGELIAGSKHCRPPAPAFRAWLAGRLAAFFGG